MVSSVEFQLSNLEVVNEGKASVPIRTGIGFFDHMLDQFPSHAQIGVGVELVKVTAVGGGGGDEESLLLLDEPQPLSPVATPVTRKNQFTSPLEQMDLCCTVGRGLGLVLREIIATENDKRNSPDPTKIRKERISRFSCPLDEALVECEIREGTSSSPWSFGTSNMDSYGRYPKTGRTYIGHWHTKSIYKFWSSLAEAAGLHVHLQKLRGTNAHHIVEASFKAFARALRLYLDDWSIWLSGSPYDLASRALDRQAKIERSTKETSISVDLKLNGSSYDTTVQTGIPVLDEFYVHLAEWAHMTLQVHCKGDLWVDDHHTAEDISIAIGQCLTEALGTKAGLNRMWIGRGVVNDALVEVVMDLSNRPYLGHNLHSALAEQEYIVEPSGFTIPNGDGPSPLSCEMLEHVLDSLVMNSRMTVHIVVVESGISLRDTVMATAQAFGKALFGCAMVDLRRAGQTASSKGTLSV